MTHTMEPQIRLLGALTPTSRRSAAPGVPVDVFLGAILDGFLHVVKKNVEYFGNYSNKLLHK
jgi:hypothetical protein